MSKFQRTNISLNKENAENKPNKVLEAVSWRVDNAR